MRRETPNLDFAQPSPTVRMVVGLTSTNRNWLDGATEGIPKGEAGLAQVSDTQLALTISLDECAVIALRGLQAMDTTTGGLQQ